MFDKDDDGGEFNISAANGILAIIDIFAAEGHSGGSAPYAISMVTKLLNYEILSPLTGEDDEWTDVSESSGEQLWQNKRLSSVFRNRFGDCYDVNGPVFEDQNGDRFSAGGYSFVPVKFPYVPAERQLIKIYVTPYEPTAIATSDDTAVDVI